MEVRFLPRTDGRRGGPAPFASAARIRNMEVLRPLDARLAENTKHARTLAAVVLAAGKGKRLKSSTPKVLHPICGRPALWHVLQGVLATKPAKIVLVVGHGADEVRAAVESWGLKPRPVFVEQAEQLGTGHAVLEAEHAVVAHRTCSWSAATSIP